MKISHQAQEGRKNVWYATLDLSEISEFSCQPLKERCCSMEKVFTKFAIWKPKFEILLTVMWILKLESLTEISLANYHGIWKNMKICKTYQPLYLICLKKLYDISLQNNMLFLKCLIYCPADTKTSQRRRKNLLILVSKTFLDWSEMEVATTFS